MPTAANDEREPENAVDDRGHGGEVLDVELEQPVVPALLVRVLLEVDRGAATPIGTDMSRSSAAR